MKKKRTPVPALYDKYTHIHSMYIVFVVVVFRLFQHIQPFYTEISKSNSNRANVLN